MVLETFIDVCYVLIMQLNHFSNKNLKSTIILVSLKQIKSSTCAMFLKLPVPANQPHPFSLPVGEQKSQRSRTINCQIPLHEQTI